ncbi:MAG: hypothetical protein KBE65_04820 [Phycisphaerae bacterium]|nr:hypothetical protein [Phycisphaerae bacterium]
MKIRWLSLVLVPLLAGCSRERVCGVSLSLGSFERGLWYDHDMRQYDEHGFGIKFDLVGGNMLRPLKNPFGGENPWRGGADRGVLRCPVIGPFLSIALGPCGVYLGFKTYEVTTAHGGQDRYGKWIRPEEVPPEGRTYQYLCPSASIRRTRWK